MRAIVSLFTLTLIVGCGAAQDIHPSVNGKPWIDEFDAQSYTTADIGDRTIDIEQGGPRFGAIFEGVKLSSAMRMGEQLMREYVITTYQDQKVEGFTIDQNAIVYVEIIDSHAEDVGDGATWFYLLGRLTDTEPTNADEMAEQEGGNDLADEATNPFDDDPTSDEAGQGNQIDDVLSEM